MLQSILTLVFALLVLTLIPASAETTSRKPLPEFSKLYDPARNAFEDGRQAIKLAKQTNRQVLIIVGGEWCSWCKAMDRFIESTPAVYRKLHNHYVVLKVNVSEKNDNSKFLSAFPKTQGIPHLFIANQKGSVLRSQANYPLLRNGKYSQNIFLRFLARWQHNTDNSTR